MAKQKTFMTSLSKSRHRMSQIQFSVDPLQLQAINRAARRQAMLESGQKPARAAVHGGNKRDKNRRNRRHAKLEARKGGGES